MANNPTPINYASRDEFIQSGVFFYSVKNPELSQEMFANYWRDIHGPLASRLPGLGYYVQQHYSAERVPHLWPEGVKRMDLELSGMAEIGFANSENQARFIDESPVLFGDEFNAFACTVAYNLSPASRTLVDREPTGIPNGPSKFHTLHLYLNGGGAKEFRSWVPKFAQQLADSSAVQRLRLHLPPPYDNAHPAPPSPGVDHHAGDEQIDVAIIEISFESALSARLFFETKEFKATLDGQSKNIRSLGVYFVSGVYTYVRDGKLTTAGLRGSRSAELINQIGATNQIQENVAKRFTSNFSDVNQQKKAG